MRTTKRAGIFAAMKAAPPNAKQKKLLICNAPIGVNGEISQAIALAEAWVRQGKSDFDLRIYYNCEEHTQIKDSIQRFEKSILALQANYIQVTVFSSPSGSFVKGFPVLKAPTTEYTCGLVYPTPSFNERTIEIFHKSMRSTLPATFYSKHVRLTEGYANNETEYDFHEISGLTQLATGRKMDERLALCQPPCAVSTEYIRPGFTKGLTYYLIYSNPKLTTLFLGGISYKDAICIFVLDAHAKRPSEDVTIYFNNPRTPELQKIDDIVKQLHVINPGLVIEYDEIIDGKSVTTVITPALATGPTVKLKVYPTMEHNEFIGLIKHAEMAMLSSTSCLDEALAMGKPCLINEVIIIDRLPRIRRILTIESKCTDSPRFTELTEFLQLHRLLAFKTLTEKKPIYQRLIMFLNSPKVDVLSKQFKAFKQLIVRKYNLSEELYTAVDQLEKQIMAKREQPGTSAGVSKPLR
ncbi:MAG: hypothetical protein P1U34_10675 [Coxiellaceae bacterium]|nr:hypothetical protein [Coxiellaceae bacterium]